MNALGVAEQNKWEKQHMTSRFAISMSCCLWLLAGAGLIISPFPAAADPVAEFYAGKQIQMIIRSTAGTSYDTYARLLGIHMVKHIPGQPTIVITDS